MTILRRSFVFALLKLQRKTLKLQIKFSCFEYLSYVCIRCTRVRTVLRGSVKLPLVGVHFFSMRTNICLFTCFNSLRARRSGQLLPHANKSVWNILFWISVMLYVLAIQQCVCYCVFVEVAHVFLDL